MSNDLSLILAVHDMAKCRHHLIPYLQRLHLEYKSSDRILSSLQWPTKAPNPFKAPWNFIISSKVTFSCPDRSSIDANNLNKYFMESVDNLFSISSLSNDSTSMLDEIPGIDVNFWWNYVSDKYIVHSILSLPRVRMLLICLLIFWKLLIGNCSVLEIGQYCDISTSHSLLDPYPKINLLVSWKPDLGPPFLQS